MGGQHVAEGRAGGKLLEIHVIFISWWPESIIAVVASISKQ